MSRVIVITGGSDGIGAAAARRLKRDGHRVVLVGRSPEKTKQVANELGADYFVADFAELDQVRILARQLRAAYSQIDVLANNAGGVFGRRAQTIDGHEKTFQVNYLAPFLLTNLLLDVLIESRSTVIQTASVAARLFGRLDLTDLDNRAAYSANKAYGDSKLANILFTRELHHRFHSQGLNAVAFHPGFIGSSFASDTTSAAMKLVYSNPLTRPFLSSPDQGANQLVWLAENEADTSWRPGTYYEKGKLARRVNRQMHDAHLSEELWEASLQRCGLTDADTSTFPPLAGNVDLPG